MSVKEGTRQVGTRKAELSPRLRLRFAQERIHYMATIGLPLCANTATTAMHVPPFGFFWATNVNSEGSSPGEVHPICWVICKCCHLTPFLTFWGLNTIFLEYFFSSTNTKTIFWGTKTTTPYRIWSFWTQIPFFALDLFGSNFQWPAAHTHQFWTEYPPRVSNSPCRDQWDQRSHKHSLFWTHSNLTETIASMSLY